MLSRQECIDRILANAKKIIEVMPLKNGTRLPNRLLIAKKITGFFWSLAIFL